MQAAVGRARTVTARVVAGLAAVFWGVLWFGIIDLLVVVTQDEQFHHHYLMESGWGLLYLVVVTLPLLVLAVRPGAPVPLAQLGVASVAVLAGAVWGVAWPQAWNGLGLVATTGVLALLGPRPALPRRRPDVALSVLALVALPAAVAYGAPLARNTTDVEDITNGVSHYPMQASLGLAVVGVVLLAAVTRSRLPAWCAAFCVAWIGVESVVYPDLPGSLGVLAGVLAVVWAALAAVAGEAATRRADPTVRAEPAAVT